LKKTLHLLVAIIAMALVVVPFFFSIDDIGMKFFGLKWPLHCALHSLTGQKCALCGMTRSFSSMAHLDFARAFQYHRIGPLLYCFFILTALYHTIAYIRFPRSFPRWVCKLNLYSIVIIFAATIINWAIEVGIQTWTTINT